MKWQVFGKFPDGEKTKTVEALSEMLAMDKFKLKNPGAEIIRIKPVRNATIRIGHSFWQKVFQKF